jgi:hypothetical protein
MTEDKKVQTAEKDRKTKPDEPLQAGSAKKLSRLERLKKKIKKAQGKDPDIYPMW